MIPAGARLRQLASAAVDAVYPDHLVQRTLQRIGDHLIVDGHQYQLNHNVYLVGAGKAVLAMARAAEPLLRPHLVCGVLSIPAGGPPPEPPPGIELHQGAADNLPDSERAAGRISQLASCLTESDLLLVLLSGCGSALLPAPRPPLTLAAKARLTRSLAARGASIQELNAVRRALSRLKGGGLARLAAPARCVALILSDVIGDPLEMIASGPTVVGGDPAPAAAEVLRRYSLLDDEGVQQALESATRDWTTRQGTSDGDGQNCTSLVHNVLVGSNRLALEAMRKTAAADHQAVLLSSVVHGDCGEVATLLAKLAVWLVTGRHSTLPEDLAAGLKSAGVPPEALADLPPPLSGRQLCLLLGGETTVTVTGGGRGGRNQQLALAFAAALDRLWTESGQPSRPPPPVSLLCFGTDGADGPTDAAGAVVDGGTAAVAREEGLDPGRFLADNDSYGFFARFRGGAHHIRTGPTGTNVMDVMALVVGSAEPASHI